MEHIEEAGIHSGDSSAVLPPYTIAPVHLGRIRDMTRRLGLALQVRGLMNVQFAIHRDTVYALEVNPRASRTVPFVSKATGVPLAKVAARVMAGRTLEEQGIVEDLSVDRFFIKTPVFPFLKFPGSDILLGPEMKSTGEVMGISEDFGIAFAKAQAAAGNLIPTDGTAFISVNDYDKGGVLPHARALREIGFRLIATRGPAEFLNAQGVEAEIVHKVNEGRPNVVDRIQSGEVALVINTPLGRESFYDDAAIRTNATLHGVLCVTTLTAAAATVQAIRALRRHTVTVTSLQEIHERAAGRASAGSLERNLEITPGADAPSEPASTHST
jgi:carbamoyl-phosphate synthase large subunit